MYVLSKPWATTAASRISYRDTTIALSLTVNLSFHSYQPMLEVVGAFVKPCQQFLHLWSIMQVLIHLAFQSLDFFGIPFDLSAYSTRHIYSRYDDEHRWHTSNNRQK